MGETFGVEAEAEKLCEEFEAAYERATADRGAEQSVLYLIWRDPWMTVAPETYISQTLALFGWRHRSPSGADRAVSRGRPRWTCDVDRVLLSSEPFHFKEQHVGRSRSWSPALPSP